MTETTNIRIIQKPDEMSFDVIHQLLEKAHQQLRKQGIHMLTAELTGAQLKERIGNGVCFVAMSENTPVGTVSLRIVERNRWYHKGNCVDLILLAVDPAYSGKHIASMLIQKIEQYAVSHGYDGVELDTAETNTKALQIYEKKGYQKVSYFLASNKDHYSIVMYKRMNKPPFSKLYCHLRYQVKKWKVKRKNAR